MEWCDENGIDFIFGLPGNADILANLRLVLEVEVQAGNQHAAKHSAPGLWTLLDRLGPQCAPWLLRGDRDWGNEGVISEAERRGQAYQAAPDQAGETGARAGDAG